MFTSCFLAIYTYFGVKHAVYHVANGEIHLVIEFLQDINTLHTEELRTASNDELYLIAETNEVIKD